MCASEANSRKQSKSKLRAGEDAFLLGTSLAAIEGVKRATR